jgi:hypothetical protein
LRIGVIIATERPANSSLRVVMVEIFEIFVYCGASVSHAIQAA